MYKQNDIRLSGGGYLTHLDNVHCWVDKYFAESFIIKVNLHHTPISSKVIGGGSMGR